MTRSIKFTLKPRWNEIEKIRNRSRRFLASHGLSDDNVQAFTMVISELIENSVKYGKFETSNNEVIVDIQINGKTVTVEVINPVDETVYTHLKALDKTIQWIRGFQDPFEAYVERLKAVAKKPLDDDDSGLGLARIAYEGQAILDFFLSEDHILNVSAVSNP
ncbi:MAG: ATP-binding protein [Desulfobacterales bacterium]|nr:MAG: ATP-binding protein [Desulfobacterales bacterium]